MAVAPRLQALSSKWQIPLLAVSVVLFLAGLFHLRPAVPEVTVDDLLREVRLALQAERFEQASQALTSLLNGKTELTDRQRAIAHRMLAETIWQAESSRTTHDPEHARRILANFLVARQYGDPVQDADYVKLAQAADWMGDFAQALDSYDKALTRQGADRVSILQRLVEILLSQAKRDWPRIDGYIEQLIAEASARPDALLRAVQWRMQRLLADDNVEAAKALIKAVESRLDVPPWSYHLQYFQALLLYRQDQLEAAEARLRALQARLRRSEPLYAQAGWLLGRINYTENRPEIALSFYDEIVRTHAGTEYWLASLLGKAEALAGLNRYAAAAESYEHAIEAFRRSQGSLLLDEHAIRQSLRTLAMLLSQQGRPLEALPFVQIAERLVPPDDNDLLAGLIELEARIRVQDAEECLRYASDPQPPYALADVREPGPGAPLPSSAATHPQSQQAAAAGLEGASASAQHHSAAAATLPAGAPAPADSQPAPQDPAARGRAQYARAGDLYAEILLERLRDLQARNPDAVRAAMAKLGIDPVELRKRNLVQKGEEIRPKYRPLDADLFKGFKPYILRRLSFPKAREAAKEFPKFQEPQILFSFLPGDCPIFQKVAKGIVGPEGCFYFLHAEEKTSPR